MSIVNLQRDALFVSPEKTALDFSSATTFSEAGPLETNADSTVYEAYSSARHDRDNTITFADLNQVKAFGLYMRPPGLELTPYRVKCYASSNDISQQLHLVIGYAEGSITGTDDEITFFSTYIIDNHLDELFLIEPETTTGDAPIYFGISVRGVSTSAKITAGISVQRLATSPPQFSQSVS